MTEKRRKATNTKRKEEIDGLKEEVRKLRRELKLQADVRDLQPPGETGCPRPPLEQVLLENKGLRSAIHRQQLDNARVQSALPPPWEHHPLCTYIHLTKNWHDRRRTLLGVRERKFRDAYEYITARTHSTSSASYSSDDRFETASGDVCAVLFQSVELPGVKSLKQVYDAVVFSVNNAEISISERLGHVTTRDDYDCGVGSISNARIVSTNDIGISTEINCVMFAQLFAAADKDFVGIPCGIVALEFVDEDELFPYKSRESIRKDVSSAVVVTAENTNGDELTVTLRRAAFVKYRRPQFEISEAAWHESQQEASRWGDVMLRSIRSLLYCVP
ncbi:uncharacterized protein IUM83_06567 [Phytophthora cinnamomi]|uniref:uncharacterized protein n=1 Tax=Phytophthora cinnamomi TaxID=4785 RepID=UPI00355A825A|nr:hypothetical protein IUM83_06567 [Phytophthora cinnamomi]